LVLLRSVVLTDQYTVTESCRNVLRFRAASNQIHIR
jgi:hypothetical protein